MTLHESARRDYSDHLQCLMNLEIWCRNFPDGRSAEDVAAEFADNVKESVAA